MNAPSSIPRVEKTYWQERAESAEKRLAAELQRCGRAEGALSVVTQQLEAARRQLAEAREEICALNGDDEERDEPGCELTPREVYAVGR